MLSAFACGSSRTVVKPSSPFSPQDAIFFEDGIDFIADPSSLEGRWHEDWANELEYRVREADLVAVIAVSAVRTDTAVDRGMTYRIVGNVERQLVGRAPNEEIVFMVKEGEPGFRNIDGNESRVLAQKFLVYMKWYTTESGSIDKHWHMSPATQSVLERTGSAIRRVREDRATSSEERVIVREN